jgi:GPH family glycoside/pentoside/hexuronide:cation symporter
VIPVVAKMSKTMGKKNAFLVSQGISVLGYIMLWFLFIPGKPYMFLFALPFFSFGIGSLFTLMMSMTSDVIDIDELNTGKRREGVFGAIYWLMVKFGFAFAGLATGAIMSLVGFVPDTENTEASITGIRLFYSGLPIVGTLTAMWIMRNYDHTEEKALKVSAELAERKQLKNAPKTSSGYEAGNLILLANNLTLKDYESVDLSNLSETEITALFSKTLQHKLKGLCFSPYVDGQNANDVLSELQVIRRMDIISPYTTSVRSFSCTNGNELIPQIAKQKGLKTIVGAWIGKDKKRNEKEIEGLIRLAKTGFVDIAAVGNEVLLRGDVSEEQIIEYVNYVKNELKGLNIPVCYVDTYYEYSNRPNLEKISDIILINCYPFWEGANIDNSLLQLRQMYAITQKIANGKEIVITETGWPSQGEAVKNANSTKLNAMKYFIQTQQWAKTENIEMYHFSSFDETWTVNVEGELGARWGLWDKDENLKYN